MNNQLSNFTASPNSLSITGKQRSSAYIADPGPYILTFVTSTKIPSGGYIMIVIPLDQYSATIGIECLIGTSTVNKCTISSNSTDPTSIELIMQE